MWHLKLQNKLICFSFKYSNCTFLSTFLFQRDEEREKQRQKQKKEREKLNKNRNLEELVDDANKRQQEFEKKVYNLWKLLALFGQRFCKSFHNGTALFSKKKPRRVEPVCIYANAWISAHMHSSNKCIFFICLHLTFLLEP